MPIVKRKRTIKVRPKKTTPLDAHDSVQTVLDRMGEILAAGHGTPEQRAYYEKTLTENLSYRLQSIAARAEGECNFEFMHGSYKQAADLYVVASILYEKFPEHIILSDAAFDGLARFLLKNYKKVDKDFWSWYNITSLDLKAGTGHNVLARDWIPGIIKHITGQDIPNAQDRSRPLRRKTIKRRKPTSGGTGSKTGKPVPRSIKRKKPAKKSKDNKAG